MNHQVILAAQRRIDLADGDVDWQFVPGMVEIYTAKQARPTQDCEQECYTQWLNRNLADIERHIAQNWQDDWDKVVMLNGTFPEHEIYSM